MARVLKHKRGTTAQHAAYTGPAGEVTVDTDKKTIVIHDGTTAGGNPLPVVGDITGIATTAAEATVAATSGVTTVAAISSSATINLLNPGAYFKLDMYANVTSFSVVNTPTTGYTVMILITQKSGGPFTLTWPASFKWEGAAPAISNTAAAVDLLCITTFDGGTTWHATLSKGRV